MMQPAATWVQGETRFAVISIVVMRGSASVTETRSRSAVGEAAAQPPCPSAGVEDDDDALIRTVQLYLRRRAERSAAAANDSSGWNRFYELYDPLVRRVARSWGLPDADLDDCVQEVWTELIAQIPKLDYDAARGRFRSWLFTVVRRKVIRFVRRKMRGRVVPLADSALLSGRENDPSIECQRQETGQIVMEMLSTFRCQLSEVNYRVLHLRWIDGRSSTEIAASVDLTKEQVRWRLHRMKRKLRALIAPQITAIESVEVA